MLQAKVAARRTRQLAEEQRSLEESTARQLLDLQNRQMRGATSAGEKDDMFKSPLMKTQGESVEEQALKKQHVSHSYT